MKEQKNEDIRAKARTADIRLWEVAEECGVTAGTLTVWLRRELNGERREQVLTAIDAIIARRQG